MSDAYERERQNNSRLAELSSKVSALRGVTVDIYDNARAQDVIDNTVCFLLSFCDYEEERGACKLNRGKRLMASTVRYVLLNERKLERIRESIGKNGCEWK
jgi:hypothetical protein